MNWTPFPIFFSSPFCFQGFSQHFSQKTMQHPAPPWKPTNQKQQLRGLSGVQLTTLPPTSAPRVKTWQQMTSPSCQRSPYLCEFCWHQVCRGLRKTGWITVSRKVEKGMDYIWKNFIERERESMYRVYAYSIHTHSVKTNVYIYIYVHYVYAYAYVSTVQPIGAKHPDLWEVSVCVSPFNSHHGDPRYGLA